MKQSSRRHPVRIRRTAAIALLLAAVAVFGCSRKPAPEASDGSSSDTTSAPLATGTTTAEQPTSTVTTVPPISDVPASEPPPEEAFGFTAEELASFRAAYAAAFTAECQRIFASVGGGPLADPDFPEDQYVVDDCLFELDDTWGELTNSVDEARSAGVDDAQIAASDLADPLCDLAATVCWSYGD